MHLVHGASGLHHSCSANMKPILRSQTSGAWSSFRDYTSLPVFLLIQRQIWPSLCFSNYQMTNLDNRFVKMVMCGLSATKTFAWLIYSTLSKIWLSSPVERLRWSHIILSSKSCSAACTWCCIPLQEDKILSAACQLDWAPGRKLQLPSNLERRLMQMSNCRQKACSLQ